MPCFFHDKNKHQRWNLWTPDLKKMSRNCQLSGFSCDFLPACMESLVKVWNFFLIYTFLATSLSVAGLCMTECKVKCSFMFVSGGGGDSPQVALPVFTFWDSENLFKNPRFRKTGYFEHAYSIFFYWNLLMFSKDKLCRSKFWFWFLSGGFLKQLKGNWY